MTFAVLVLSGDYWIYFLIIKKITSSFILTMIIWASINTFELVPHHAISVIQLSSLLLNNLFEWFSFKFLISGTLLRCCGRIKQAERWEVQIYIVEIWHLKRGLFVLYRRQYFETCIQQGSRICWSRRNIELLNKLLAWNAACCIGCWLRGNKFLFLEAFIFNESFLLCPITYNTSLYLLVRDNRNTCGGIGKYFHIMCHSLSLHGLGSSEGTHQKDEHIFLDAHRWSGAEGRIRYPTISQLTVWRVDSFASFFFV